MPPLAEIQSRLRESVVAGDDAVVLPLLVGGQEPEKRLRIHRRHYEASLVTALLGKFPGTVWLVGSPFTIEAAREFVRRYPPRTPCIAGIWCYVPALPTLAAGSRSHSLSRRVFYA